MDTNKLTTAGLSAQQALCYALLIEHGEVSPPTAAIKLKLTRTNAYKLLDKLVDMGLATKTEELKKFSYRPSNPLALTNLSAELRAQAAAREEAVNSMMNGLLSQYYQHSEQPLVESVTGKLAVADAYRKQIGLREDIYFIHSRADVPMMGFDTMHEIRVAPSYFGLSRHGILADRKQGTLNAEGHKRSNLDVTWVKHEDYNSPVEWSITKSSLMIVLYGSEPHAISIFNPIIAQAFLQLWHLLDSCLRAMPYYTELPRALTKSSNKV